MIKDIIILLLTLSSLFFFMVGTVGLIRLQMYSAECMQRRKAIHWVLDLDYWPS